MNVAFLFDSQHPTLTGIYGYAVMRMMLGTGVLQAGDRHMRISRGEVLTGSPALLGESPTSKRLVDVRKKVYAPIELDLLLRDRSTAPFGRGKVWCWLFQNMTAALALGMHDSLEASPAYLGAMDVDFSNPLHLYCFRNSLPEVYRVMGRRCWLFYQMGERDAVDAATKEIFEEHGFAVDYEDIGLRRTLLDNYDTIEHFRRVEDFKRIVARFEGLDDDTVSDLALFLEEIHPALFDVLASASRTLDRAETREDLAQASLSGRRLLESIADYLYPPRKEKEKGRSLDTANYKNRLAAYIEDALREIGMEDSSILDRMGVELSRLIDLFNGGLHIHCDRAKNQLETAFRDLVIWLTKAIQLSPTHARNAYLAYDEQLREFSRRIVETRQNGLIPAPVCCPACIHGLRQNQKRDAASCAKILDVFVNSGPSADFSFVLLTSGLRYDDVGGRDLGFGQVAERLMAADCKSAFCRSRRHCTAS